MTARGTFEVKLTPHAQAEPTDLGRLAIEKTIHGDLEATSKGEMLSAGTATKGSAGYVAIERVTGSLQGRRGSFFLMHSGMMTRGLPQLTIKVVPDSGTEELLGLSGSFSITITDGKHFYEFQYNLESGS
jgi:hypothetical protein